MDFITRMRKDARYRFRVVLIAMLLVMFFTSSGTDKKEARIFNPSSNCDGKLFTECPTTSDNGILCSIEYNNFWMPDTCVNCVRTGMYSINVNNCCSGYSVSGNERTCDGQTCYLCRDALPTDETCNAAEQGLANILQGMVPSLSCKTAFYLTIFGAGFLLLMVFAMF